MPSITINDKLNMTLDEIIMEELSNENKELSQLVKERNDNSIVSLYDWIIHIDSYGDEYIRGFKR